MTEVGSPGDLGEVAAPCILIVDDDEPTRALYSQVLRRARLNVVEAANGEVALDLIRERDIALVLLDLGGLCPPLPGRAAA